MKRVRIGRRPVDHEMFRVGAQLLLAPPEPLEPPSGTGAPGERVAVGVGATTTGSLDPGAAPAVTPGATLVEAAAR